MAGRRRRNTATKLGSKNAAILAKLNLGEQLPMPMLPVGRVPTSQPPRPPEGHRVSNRSAPAAQPHRSRKATLGKKNAAIFEKLQQGHLLHHMPGMARPKPRVTLVGAVRAWRLAKNLMKRRRKKEKMLARRKHIVQEILQTEREYVRSLEHLVHSFWEPIRQLELPDGPAVAAESPEPLSPDDAHARGCCCNTTMNARG